MRSIERGRKQVEDNGQESLLVVTIEFFRWNAHTGQELRSHPDRWIYEAFRFEPDASSQLARVPFGGSERQRSIPLNL